jgi:ribulose-bisphosphate carboxylase large chain
MKYEDFVDLNYKPSRNDLICKFFIDARNLKRAAGAVAAESSIGTWTEVKTEKPYVKKLAAKVFEIRRNLAKIAYPLELFELGNMPNILSSIAGNIFGMKEVKNLKLLDIHFPKKIVKSFKGPKYGIKGVRKILRIKNRPLIGTIIKPKLGLKTGDHAKVAYEAWVGGCDIVKDDENLASQSFNKFKKRLEKTLKMKKRAERETGEKKGYMINITASFDEMIKRAKLVENFGNEYAMVDIIAVGWAALQTLREMDFKLILHAHRAGHAAFTRNKKHGISMKVIAKISRIIGVDQLHVGTIVGKMFEERSDVLENVKALKEDLFKLRKTMPVASGGLKPSHVPLLANFFGNDVIIQFGGGIHGHPLGTFCGARAVRQAIDAVIQKIPLKEYAKTHEELKIALKHWK